jgi:hypothetical protein
MNGTIRPFAGTDKTFATPDYTLPPAMGGKGHGLHRDVALARATRSNVLVVGPDQAVSNALALIIVDVERAVVLDRASERLRLPSPTRPIRTVIIRNIDALTDDEQRDLLEWLMVSKGLSRVIATTSRALVSMLDSNEFSPTLYYRLNVVYVDLS